MDPFTISMPDDEKGNIDFGRPEHSTYQPPTPSIFGNSQQSASRLPRLKVFRSSDGLQTEHDTCRPTLQDRLATYVDDNPRCQRFLSMGGLICFPLWIVGAAIYVRTPESKPLSREAGFKNVMLSI